MTSSVSRPIFSYRELITMAINSSKSKKLRLSEIYKFITENFTYYQMMENKSWNNAIRHNLSLHDQFMKEHLKSGDQVSKYWVINPNVVKKSRKRKGFSVNGSIRKKTRNSNISSCGYKASEASEIVEYEYNLDMLATTACHISPTETLPSKQQLIQQQQHKRTIVPAVNKLLMLLEAASVIETSQ